eukprot:COSAG05_NODE_2934_length_2489_cov_2.459414_2_plen_92_part_00
MFFCCSVGFVPRVGVKPSRIVFYRDGVSEGQFKQVMTDEVQALRRACKRLEPSYMTPTKKSPHRTLLTETRTREQKRMGPILFLSAVLPMF